MSPLFSTLPFFLALLLASQKPTPERGWGGGRRIGYPLFGGGLGLGGLGGGGLLSDLLSGGVGYLMGKNGAQNQQQQAAQYQQLAPQYQQYPPQYQQPYQQPAPQYQPSSSQRSAGNTQDNRLAQLRQLGQLREQGVLTEDEFRPKNRES
jgi:predicted lipid-binding transport protein (Tim44 family)